MDPINRGPEEYGHDTEGEDVRPAPSAAVPVPVSTSSATRVRTARLVSGGLLLTVNPLDGSEIEICPPADQPAAPRRRSAQERAETTRAAGPPVPPGPAAPALPLLERTEQREALVQHLTRGRSARLTGPAGSGRSRLLDAVAADCARVAPDGVVRLSGHHRTPTDLLYELFQAVQYAPAFRPDREELLLEVRGIGAIVVVDDLEFGGKALDELLAATPDCAFLLAATPDTPAPSADAGLEEVELPGLGRAAAVELLEHATGRALTDDEINWAGDLWFESEGLPLRFVQAGALLRQRDRLRVGPAEFDAFGALEEAFGSSGAPAPVPALADPTGDPDVEVREIPLPSLGEGAAPAVLLASRLSRAAQDTLRFAVALGGEVPHQAHLPALVGDTHADAAVGELMACGLLSPVGPRYRLAAGVLTQLLAQEYEPEPTGRADTVAQHYAWWAGHPSVTPERATAEADSLLAALTALVPSGAPDHTATAVQLARAAAPAFAAGLHWSAWERALRGGQEAARRSGDVAEEAWFHHELGVLSLCRGRLQRARAELEASIGLRGALADKRGTVAGRRALALVADLTGESAPIEPLALSAPHDFPALPPAGSAPGADPGATGPTAVLPPVPPAVRPAALPRREGPASPPRGVPVAAPLPAKSAFPNLAPPSAAYPTYPSYGGKPAVPAQTSPAASADAFAAFSAEPPTVVVGHGPGSGSGPDGDKRGGLRTGILAGARRNLAAVGAGALLVAVLGTVVTIGATSGDADDPAGRVTSDSTAPEDPATDDGDGGEADPTDGATDHPSESAAPGTGSSPTPGSTASTGTPTATTGTPTATGSASTSTSPSPTATTKPPKPTTSPTKTTPPSPSPSSTPPKPPTTPPTPPTTEPTPSQSASEESPSNSASASRSESVTPTD
ncbi:ATP-binding protein [Streptomyces sp. NPDC090025]|uniref:ATP-binding protein n=1 Tax=Streptomyces sp. NPDC090025 TaxID=3365922 RepID=UPI00383787B8